MAQLVHWFSWISPGRAALCTLPVRTTSHLSHVTPGDVGHHIPGHCLGQVTAPRGPHPHLGLGTNTRQCLIKLLLNLFNLLLRAWRSSQQPAVWADVVCRGEQSTAVTECCKYLQCLQVTPGTVQGCRELQAKKMTKWINMEANLTGLEQLEQGVEDRGLKSLLWKV